ncbi:MAG: outer membrane protein assembly factor BamD [Deltaproteobacteria bacterium]|nr:outer membrane protein assembly factor BamD [Deltaproteobacteria bacterium]MCL5276301.1 outer membrane protein assembly factor BamD [Deltaproteobacteria bacterium]
MRDRGYIALSFVLASLVAGCATAPVQKQPGPKEYYNKALDELKGGSIFGADYEQARGTLNQIIDNYPYSAYAPLAQLRIGDSYYREGRYLESAEAYEHFVKMYPNDDNISYAVFMEGKSFLNNQKTWLIGSIPYDIDQTGIYNALDEFRYIADNYPSSKYAPEAKKYAQKCEYTLGRYDMYVADFYIHHGYYEAAIGRLREVYNKYPGRGLGDRALHELAGIYRRIGAQGEYRRTVELLKEAYPRSGHNK